MVETVALVLAAGRGSRMGDLTADKPKCLNRFMGTPLLVHQLSALTQSGIETTGAVTGYKKEMLEDYGLTLFNNARWDQTNMVVSLTCAEEWLTKYACIVSYSDIFYSPETVRRLADCDGDIAITYDPDWRQVWEARFEDPLSDAETFKLDESGTYVIEIGARAQEIEDIKGQYMGLLRFTPKGWEQVSAYLGELSQDQLDKLDMTSLLSALIARDVKIQAVPQSGGWGEIDNSEDLSVYEEMHRASPFPWIQEA